MSKILVIDNYDSFTYNLVHLLRDVTGSQPVVVRNDEISVADVSQYDQIVLSPGPGIPSEAGIIADVVREFSSEKSILGVCLGHQCIAEVFGGTLRNLEQVSHGKGLGTIVTDREDRLFSGMPERFDSGRYHSWVVDHTDFPATLAITAIDDDNKIMALRHREFRVWGVQFHPESILTPDGATLLQNWISI